MGRAGKSSWIGLIHLGEEKRVVDKQRQCCKDNNSWGSRT